MNIEEARIHVTEVLGPSWLLGPVKASLVPGPSVGDPTRRRVQVTLDWHPGWRTETDHEGQSVSAIGPHLTFEGIGQSIEEALAAALGTVPQADSYGSVEHYGSATPHAQTQERERKAVPA